jgi:integrase
MPTVDDPNNNKSRLAAAKEEFNSLPSEDRQFVLYWLNNGADGYAPSTKVNHISHLLTIHDELDTCFADASKYEWTGAVAALADRRDWSSGTKRNYQKSIRSLLEDIEGDVIANKDDITLSKDDSGGKIDEEDIPSLDEVRTLINEASNRVRDQAMFAVLIDLGLRVSALCRLRVRDFEHKDGDSVGELTVNDDALGQKGAGGRTHVSTFSSGYIRNYLRTEHPRLREADAPLFHKIGRHYDPDDPNDDGSISPAIFRRRMKRDAKNTDIDPDKLHPHNMKHAAVTIWALRGMSDREIPRGSPARVS